jgi:hypothetical protein
MIRRLLPAVVLPVLVTGVTLAGVAWNRSGGRAAIVLSHRELPLRSISDDNTGRTLSIHHQSPWWSGPGWLGAEKLASLGFDTSVDARSPGAEAHYRRALRRIVYVALELDGPAWQAWARTYDENTKRWSPGADNTRLLEDSARLVAVDAAADAATLEAKYPDPATHVITRGVVRLFIDHPEGGEPRLSGMAEQIAPSTLYVPHHLAAPLGSKPYRVRVRYGRRYEPWIVGVER